MEGNEAARERALAVNQGTAKDLIYGTVTGLAMGPMGLMRRMGLMGQGEREKPG